jgi:hypothetical protein
MLIWLHIVYQAIVIHGWFTAYSQRIAFTGGFWGILDSRLWALGFGSGQKGRGLVGDLVGVKTPELGGFFWGGADF